MRCQVQGRFFPWLGLLVAPWCLDGAETGSVAAASCKDDGYLHSRLCEAWKAKQAAGVVKLGGLKTRQLGGRFGLLAQFAPQRNQGPEVDEEFHFGSAKEDEVLLCFNPKPEGSCQHTASKNTCVMPKFVSAWPPGGEECQLNSTEPAVVLLHSRPLCPGHVIVVPDLSHRLPQVLSEDYLVLGLAFAMRASPRAWLSFSSMDAGAEADHLHWEAFYPVPTGDSMFPFQAHLARGGALQAAIDRGPISLSFTPEWPLRAWIFTWTDHETLELDSALAEWRMAEFLMAFISRLQGRGVNFHLFLSSGGTRATVIPRKARKPSGGSASQLQVSSQEVLGWWPLAEEADFEALDADSAANSMHAAALDAKQEKIVVEALQDAGWHLADAASRPNVWILTDSVPDDDNLHGTDSAETV